MTLLKRIEKLEQLVKDKRQGGHVTLFFDEPEEVFTHWYAGEENTPMTFISDAGLGREMTFSRSEFSAFSASRDTVKLTNLSSEWL